MAKKELSPQYLSEFCAELALLVRAGITISDGVTTLALDFEDKNGFLTALGENCESGQTLHDSLESTQMVPSYMLDMIQLGERSGRLEATLISLSGYYESRAKLNAAIRSALTYPLVLIVMLAAVVVVLVTKVLPIFADVFTQMGAQLPAFSLALINFGTKLSSVSAIIIWILAGIVVAGLIVVIIYPLRKLVAGAFRRYFGTAGIFKQTVTSQFAAAMTTAISSGLDSEEAVILAGNVVQGIKKTDEGLNKCREMIKQGEGLEKSLAASQIFAARDTRLLTLGVRTGTTETVMADIAKRSEERALAEIDSALGKIEPTLVIIISIVVCAVLLSVMLPLTGIMSSIG